MTPAQPATAPTPDAFPPPPAAASACPRCGSPSSPRLQAQTCQRCGARFLLRAGALMDASVKPPAPDAAAKDVKLKAPGLIVVSQALVMADRIGFGALDPILGRFPIDIDEKSVRFNFLYSIAVWRGVNASQAVMFFVISLPVGLGGVAAIATLTAPGLIFGLPFLALAAFHGWRVFGRKATRMRVIGFKDRTLDMTFVGSFGARQRFLDELFRRCGLEQAPIP